MTHRPKPLAKWSPRLPTWFEPEQREGEEPEPCIEAEEPDEEEPEDSWLRLALKQLGMIS